MKHEIRQIAPKNDKICIQIRTLMKTSFHRQKNDSVHLFNFNNDFQREMYPSDNHFVFIHFISNNMEQNNSVEIIRCTRNALSFF